MLAKDLKEIRMYDSNSLKALSQVISKAGTYTVVLNKDDIRTVGGALSSRIPLKTANGKKGFFTANKVFNHDEKWKENIEDFEARFKFGWEKSFRQR